MSKTNKKNKKKSSEAEDEYVVEKILAKKGKGKNLEYLIKWKDFGDEENTWERVANCGCPDLIAEFEAAYAKKEKQQKSAAPRKRNTDADKYAAAVKKKKGINNNDTTTSSSVEHETPVIAGKKIKKEVFEHSELGTSQDADTTSYETHEDIAVDPNNESKDATQEEFHTDDDDTTRGTPQNAYAAGDASQNATSSSKDEWEATDATQEELQDATTADASQDIFETANNTGDKDNNPQHDDTSPPKHSNDFYDGDDVESDKNTGKENNKKEAHNERSTTPQPITPDKEPSKYKPADEYSPLKFTVTEIEDFIGDITATDQRVLVRIQGGKREVAQLKAVAKQNLDIAFDFLLSRLDKP